MICTQNHWQYRSPDQLVHLDRLMVNLWYQLKWWSVRHKTDSSINQTNDSFKHYAHLLGHRGLTDFQWLTVKSVINQVDIKIFNIVQTPDSLFGYKSNRSLWIQLLDLQAIHWLCIFTLHCASTSIYIIIYILWFRFTFIHLY